MATYYVRPDGNNGNAGTGPLSNQAWQTITYALANMTLTTGVNYLYVSAGTYRELPTVTVTPSSTQTLEIIGDPTSSLFGNVTPGIVRITNFLNDNVVPSDATVFTCAKTYVTLRNLSFHMYGNAIFTSASNLVFDKCIFENGNNPGNRNLGSLRIVSNGNNPINATISKCVFYGGYALVIAGPTTGANFNFNINVTDCFFQGEIGLLVDGPVIFNNTVGNGVSVFNSTFNCLYGMFVNSTTTSNASSVKNSLFAFPFIGGSGCRGNSTGVLIEDFNRFSMSSTRTNVTAGANSLTGTAGIDYSESTINGLAPIAFYAPYTNSPLIGSGTSTGAPTTDIYSNPWTIGTDVGAFARTSFASTSFYYPTERNASTITIAPGSTSQSIELYLGATGLTASTTGLSARYNRTRTASVDIPLVARTIAQAWTAGGFAEVDATNMPGVYRLDVPDAALAAGADDVTVVVRGASGTNGAVMTVKLSSGGLTSAQTASAVLDAVGSSYVTAGSIGYAIQNSNVASISGSTAAADELEGALLHNGTDYISAELVTPVTSAALVRMGPYEVKADGLGASDPLDIQKGAQHGVDIQCVDGNGNGIDITSATVTAKVYNSGGSLVDTYSCTATYAADGRATFTIDTTVTDTPGTYTATITRTTGASDTQVFGPLRIYVRDI